MVHTNVIRAVLVALTVITIAFTVSAASVVAQTTTPTPTTQVPGGAPTTGMGGL